IHMRVELPRKVGYKVKLSGESAKNFNENNDDEYRVNMWKLLDFAEPKRSFISVFDLDPNERRAFCVGA
ncbi:hypothetical protein Tco_0756085, partial [Tanacetum coccineum]